MRVWHDDIRPAPASWEWARTNDRALELLRAGGVEEISLDHDLGLDHLDSTADPESIYFAGPSNSGTGYDLVLTMCREELVPDVVTIHSWNPAGAERMAACLAEYGHACSVAPYRA